MHVVEEKLAHLATYVTGYRVITGHLDVRKLTIIL